MVKLILTFLKYYFLVLVIGIIFFLINNIGLYLEEGDFFFALVSTFQLIFSFNLFVLFLPLIGGVVFCIKQYIKGKTKLQNLVGFGVLLSILLGCLAFVYVNRISPKLEISSVLNRMENSFGEPFSKERRIEKTQELILNNPKFQTIREINLNIDSIQNDLLSRKKEIIKFSKKVQDSFINANFRKDIISQFQLHQEKNDNIQLDPRNHGMLQSKINQYERYSHELKKHQYEKWERIAFVLFVPFLIVISMGTAFFLKNEKIILAVCVVYVIFNLVLSFFLTFEKYFIENRHLLIGLIFESLILLALLIFGIFKIHKHYSTQN